MYLVRATNGLPASFITENTSHALGRVPSSTTAKHAQVFLFLDFELTVRKKKETLRAGRERHKGWRRVKKGYLLCIELQSIPRIEQTPA